MRILQQGVSNLEEGGDGNVKAVGMLNLYERINLQDSMKKLEAVQDHAAPSLAFRVKQLWSLGISSAGACVSVQPNSFPFPFSWAPFVKLTSHFFPCLLALH